MEITCQRPYAFYFLLLMIPAIIISIVQQRRVWKHIKFFSLKNTQSSYETRMKHFPIMMLFRTVFRCIAWTMLVFAYSGISWGTYLEPSQKNGSAVSLVFDISYSMNVKDSIGGLSRLEASEKYASMLLSHIPNSSVSVVLTKGDGVTVVPLTEDRAVVESLLDTLSPSLMSATGTSLGKGVRTALKSFPENSGSANAIWVFTDGDETDGLLESSLIECVRKGIPVCIIGFGSEKESNVTAGDGKTVVTTALRASKMKQICENVAFHNSSQVSDINVKYVEASESGSAVQLIDFISKTGGTTPVYKEGQENTSYVTYEIKPVQRYQLFLGLAIMFFALSFAITEIDPTSIAEKIRHNLATSMVLFVFLFSSCSSDGGKKLLSGTWDYYQRKYNSSVAQFLQAATDAKYSEDKILEQYSVYDLATSYLMQNENEAASACFLRVTQDSPEKVRFCAFYNLGIISYKNGDYKDAAKYFKNALKIDGKNLNAKINLELSTKKMEKEAKAQENGIVEVSENEKYSAMEEAVFQRIKQQDRKQWKNSEEESLPTTGADY